MVQILAYEIVVLFIILAGGFILVKCKALKSSDSKGISKLIIYLINPCVIINSFQVELSAENVSGFLLSILAAFILHGLTFAVVYLFSLLFKFSAIEKTSAIYSNCGNLVIPLVSTVLGPEWVIFSSVYLCVQQLFLWSHCQSVIQGLARIDVIKILKNINVIAVLIGIFLFLTNIRFPLIVDEALSKTASMIGPLSMIMLGMIMADVDFKKVFSNKRIYLTAFFRLIVVPVVMLLFIKYSGLAGMHPNGETILYISLLGVSAPSGVAVVQISQLYDNQPQYASSINVLTTLCCIATMPLITFLYYL